MFIKEQSRVYREKVLTKNQFVASQEDDFDADAESIIFISYKRSSDLSAARECAKILEDIDGVTYWIDEKDECLASARSNTSGTKAAIETAKCIEKGLDAASALLGIIGPETFKSPWVPYEIGGARGRQRFSITYTSAVSYPHPLIAHLIYDIDIEDVPDFVALGIPLFDIDEVIPWAKSVAEILEEVHESYNRKISYNRREYIQNFHEINKIYQRNTRLMDLS